MLDDFILFLVTSVIGVLLPILNIDIGNTTDQQFQFTLVEHVDKVCRNEFIESRNERIKLFFNSFLNLPLRYESV